jgi:hypothetical protein
VTEATAFAVLGAHAVPGDEEWFDAVDLVVTLGTGDDVLLGIRTHGYLDVRGEGAEQWGSYVPLPADLDLASVVHWDFSSILWLGPTSAPCLVWSNAHALSVVGVRTLLTWPRVGELLAGPGGAGLPRPADLGVEVPSRLERHAL